MAQLLTIAQLAFQTNIYKMGNVKVSVMLDTSGLYALLVITLVRHVKEF
jgi:hypothetical protein